MFQYFVISGPAPATPVPAPNCHTTVLAIGLPTSPSTTSEAQPATAPVARRLYFDDEGDTESESESERDTESESDGDTNTDSEPESE